MDLLRKATFLNLAKFAPHALLHLPLLGRLDWRLRMKPSVWRSGLERRNVGERTATLANTCRLASSSGSLLPETHFPGVIFVVGI
jgi:hypothetical protein